LLQQFLDESDMYPALENNLRHYRGTDCCDAEITTPRLETFLALPATTRGP